MATDILKLINQLSIINQVVHMLNYQANPTLFWVLGMYDMYKNNPMPASLFTCWCAFLGSCGSLSPGVLTPWVLLPVAEKSAVTGRLRPPQRLSEAASDPRPEISSNSGPQAPCIWVADKIICSPAIATGETGSSTIGCEDFRSLITSSSKRCSLY